MDDTETGQKILAFIEKEEASRGAHIAGALIFAILDRDEPLGRIIFRDLSREILRDDDLAKIADLATDQRSKGQSDQPPIPGDPARDRHVRVLNATMRRSGMIPDPDDRKEIIGGALLARAEVDPDSAAGILSKCREDLRAAVRSADDAERRAEAARKTRR
ncbi:hypothetical protein FIU86_04415 [Roseovarius sp. THAF9]|uniref:hypothetical protein n=1 Tax=Roseovarius sp. THAF9 TaxID=2587847 RepID=UPI001267A97B|nr:hypothetical protein [Roseovarius sp. THAF9]QFT92075.1 hypothetical protein FIU86_04415 [Roseovarius sp. THAF9]